MTDIPLDPEVADAFDALVHDGKVYVATDSIAAMSAAIAQMALALAPIRPDLIPGTTWVLSCHRGMTVALTNRFAAELVPDSLEGLDQ